MSMVACENRNEDDEEVVSATDVTRHHEDVVDDPLLPNHFVVETEL